MADSIPSDAVQGDFTGNVNLNYFGRYELEPNPNAGDLPLMGFSNHTVMLSTSNEVTFMSTYRSGSPAAGGKSHTLGYLLPEPCIPYTNVFIPVWAYMGGNVYDIVIMSVGGGGEVTFRDKNTNAYTEIEVAYLNGVSFNVSDRYYR